MKPLFSCHRPWGKKMFPTQVGGQFPDALVGHTVTGKGVCAFSDPIRGSGPPRVCLARGGSHRMMSGDGMSCPNRVT